MRLILLIMIGFSLLNADYTRTGNSDTNYVVKDNTTGLIWQDNNDAKTKQATWKEAINYCEALELNSKADWRLPNINELLSIVDDTRYSPAFDSEFKNVGPKGYWSSTTYSSNTKIAWIIGSFNGSSGRNDKSSSYYVRCVRAGQ